MNNNTNCKFCGLPVTERYCAHDSVRVNYKDNILYNFELVSINKLFTLYFDPLSDAGILYVLDFSLNKFETINITSTLSWNPENFSRKINNLLLFL